MAAETTAGAGAAQFAGKVAFITGAGAGIGRDTARLLASRGAAVAFMSRTEANCASARDELAALGGPVLAMVGDVADASTVEACVGRAITELGGIDVVVANAGIPSEPATVLDTTVEEWNRVLAVNLSGVFYTAKYALPSLLERGGGSIVVVGSDSSVYGWQRLLAYTASKHALVGLVRSMALDHGPEGIRTNLVCPTAVETNMVRELQAEEPETVAGWVASVPQGRMATPVEVAEVICHLASDQASFTNGHVYTLDGGLTAGIFTKPA